MPKKLHIVQLYTLIMLTHKLNICKIVIEISVTLQFLQMPIRQYPQVISDNH